MTSKTSTWRLSPPEHSATTADRGHGRFERRRICVSSRLKGESTFPGIAQVFVIERIREKLDGTLLSHELSYGATSLSRKRASPALLLAMSRGHWDIENGNHWVRDVTYDEDRSQVRTGGGPRVMAWLRCMALSIFRLAGAPNIAAAIRACQNRPERALRLIGLGGGRL